MAKLTKGEYRVGIAFNPSSDDMVSRIKKAAAELIDLIEAIPLPEFANDEIIDGDYVSEVYRLKDLSQSAIEDGAMWGVKAATKGANK